MSELDPFEREVWKNLAGLSVVHVDGQAIAERIIASHKQSITTELESFANSLKANVNPARKGRDGYGIPKWLPAVYIDRLLAEHIKRIEGK